MRNALKALKARARQNENHLLLTGLVATTIVAAYYLGKVNGTILIDTTFYPKGEDPVHLPRLRVK